MNPSLTRILRSAIVAVPLFGLVGCGNSPHKTEKQSDQAPADGKQYSSSAFAKHLEVAVFSDASAYRPGDVFRIAVVIDIDSDWHIYGNPLGPGIGLPTVISVELPEGFSSAIARYAPAEKGTQDFGEAGGTWVWEHTGQVIHFLSGTVDPGTLPGNYHAKVHVSAQVCKKMGSCLPGEAIVPLDLTVSESAGSIPKTNEELFKNFDDAAVAQAEEI